ncbi:MAG: FAD-binding oxidoreductase [Hyphomicrobiales bacterium]
MFSQTKIGMANSLEQESTKSLSQRFYTVQTIKRHEPNASQLSISYNQQLQKTPNTRIMCKSAEDVRNSIQALTQSGTPFSVRSGGHCFAGFSQHEQAVLDVRSMKGIEIDPSTARVSVDAGVTLHEAYAALAPMNLTLPGGVHPNVGLAGITLGGGVGYLSRQYGLLCDRLESVELVDASGNLLVASANEHADLFWACKGGGGGNLGVAARFVFNAVRTTTQHAIVIVDTVTPERMAAILEIWPIWSQRAPRHTTTHLDFTLYPNGKFLVILTGISSEPDRGKLMKQLQLVMQDPDPIHPNYVTTGPMEAMIPKLHKLHEYVSDSFVGNSDYLKGGISAQGAADIVATMLRHPPGSIKIIIEPMLGAVNDVEPSETAYPHRRSAFLIQYLAEFLGPEEHTSRRAVIKDTARAFEPFTTGGKYVNYPDLNLKNWQQAYWGDNFARLQEVKRKYDPDNVFNHAQSIPL